MTETKLQSDDIGSRQTGLKKGDFSRRQLIKRVAPAGIVSVTAAWLARNAMAATPRTKLDEVKEAECLENLACDCSNCIGCVCGSCSECECSGCLCIPGGSPSATIMESDRGKASDMIDNSNDTATQTANIQNNQVAVRDAEGNLMEERSVLSVLDDEETKDGWLAGSGPAFRGQPQRT